MPAARLENVTKCFGPIRAVDGLSLEVARGTIHGMIGPNGSGKTTTLRMILSIIEPDQGTIEVLGEVRRRAANDRVGYLPEERGLYRKMTVRRLLTYLGSLKGMAAAAARRKADEWLERLGLTDRAASRVETLSKGMQQKIQFIAAVLARPELLILDEPFVGLDPVNLDVLRNAILGLAREGATVVLSTHDMAKAEEMCDRITMIHRGKKVLDGSLEEIQKSFGADTVRVSVDGGAGILEGFPGIERVRDLGRYQEVRMQGDPQALLAHLAGRTRVGLFEVARPSLHDIFVRIAGPEVERAAP